MIPQLDAPALDLLKALVDATGGSDDIAEIERVNTLLEAEWRSIGFGVQRHPVQGRADLLIAELRVGAEAPDADRVAVTVVGHSDTVWPVETVGDWSHSEDAASGILSGPGIGDMKAGLVIAGLAARMVAEGCSAPGLLRLLLIPDEEVGSVGSLPIIERVAASTDLCIGLEAGKPGDGFVASRGAVGAMRIEVRGVPVHVTEPGGVNAVSAVLPLATAVAALSGPEVLVSVCRIRAGEARQITAAEGWFEVDLRAESADDLLAVVDRIRALAAAVDPAFSVEVHGGMTRPQLADERSARPMALLAELDQVREPGRPPATGIRERGGSDASFFAAAGVDTLDGFGAICWDNCGRGERVLASSLPDRAVRMAELAIAWIDGGMRGDR
jgi:glutamate carboxypeptidase